MALGVEREQAVAHTVGDGAQVVAGGAQRALGLQALGQVDRHADPAGAPSLAVEHDPGAQIGGKRRAVLVLNGVLALPVLAAVELARHLGHDARIGRGEELRGAAPHHLVVGPAVQSLGAAVPVRDAAVGVGRDDGDIDLLEQRGLRGHFLLGLFLLGHVLRRTANAEQLTVTVSDRSQAGLDPHGPRLIVVAVPLDRRVALTSRDRREILTRDLARVLRHRRQHVLERGADLHQHLVLRGERVEHEHRVGLRPPLPARQSREPVGLAQVLLALDQAPVHAVAPGGVTERDHEPDDPVRLVSQRVVVDRQQEARPVGPCDLEGDVADPLAGLHHRRTQVQAGVRPTRPEGLPPGRVRQGRRELDAQGLAGRGVRLHQGPVEPDDDHALVEHLQDRALEALAVGELLDSGHARRDVLREHHDADHARVVADRCEAKRMDGDAAERVEVEVERLQLTRERGPVARLEPHPRLGRDDVIDPFADDVGREVPVHIAVGEQDPQVRVDDQQPGPGQLGDQRAPQLGRVLQSLQVQMEHTPPGFAGGVEPATSTKRLSMLALHRDDRRRAQPNSTGEGQSRNPVERSQLTTRRKASGDDGAAGFGDRSDPPEEW